MTAAEIVMKRDDPNISWGFRLTGGADLGTPFYVVKVLGRGHAERAGLGVGDMVYAINHKYVNNFTHKDAQNEILHTGDTLILNIKRGHSSGRGTPLPEYSDPLLGLSFPPETPRPPAVPLPPYQPPPPVIKEETPPESEDEGGEDLVAAFNVKINPKGRIAEIEELPVTPPPSRSSSRARSRSRSMSKDRRRSASAKRESAAVKNGFVPVQNSFGKSQNGFKGVQNGFGGVSGPGETFTYSKEVVTQYSTVLSAAGQSEGNVSENVNESFVIHGGSTHKMEDVLSPEDIERDIFEEKMEEQKLTELLTGEAEVLDQGVVGHIPGGFGMGLQRSVTTYDRASNTDKQNSAPIPVTLSFVENPPCHVEFVEIHDDSSDVGILEIQDISDEKVLANKTEEEVDVKLVDNHGISVVEVKESVEFEVSGEEKNEISDRDVSDMLNEVKILDETNDKLNETQTLEREKVESEAGFSQAEIETAEVEMTTVQNDKPISDEINNIDELSANMTKPASVVEESNQTAQSSSSCVIL